MIQLQSIYWNEVSAKNYKKLRLLIWLYLILLIFEGALRKWILPQFSIPLLIIRDPVALIILMLGRRIIPFNFTKYIVTMLFIAIVGVITAVYLGHGNLLVALYGARILLLHFPLIFIIGGIFSRKEVIKIGKFIVILCIPMAVLSVAQFYSPQTAWINRGVGGDLEGAGFTGALGYFRPPGTFSFTNGNALFFGLVAPFLIFFWLTESKLNKILLTCSTICLLSAVPFSISRGLFFSVSVSLVFAIIAMVRRTRYTGKMVITFAAIFSLFLVLSKASFFQIATDAFTSRFESANESEGGLGGVLGERYLGGMVKAIINSSQLPFFGYGLGLGTSVGGTLLLGRAGLLLAEDEWARLIGELGLVLGLGVIIVRVSFTAEMVKRSYFKMLDNDLLPWMLTSFGILTVPQGQWAQPTALGFGIIIGGLIIASLNSRDEVS